MSDNIIMSLIITILISVLHYIWPPSTDLICMYCCEQHREVSCLVNWNIQEMKKKLRYVKPKLFLISWDASFEDVTVTRSLDATTVSF